LPLLGRWCIVSPHHVLLVARYAEPESLTIPAMGGVREKGEPGAS